MESAFFRVVVVSAAVSVILLILLLTARWQRRYAPNTRRAVWLAAAVVLLAAPLLPKAKAPVQITVPEYLAAAPVTTPTATPQALEPAEIHWEPSTGWTDNFGGTSPGAAQPKTDAVLVEAPAPSSGPAWTEVLSILWLAGGVCILLQQGGMSLLARRRLMRGAVPLTCYDKLAKELCPRRNIRFFQAARLDTPMTLGILRPVVLLPEGQVSLAVLRHELAHIRRWDVAWKTLLLLACAVHWFNPLVWLMSRRAGRDIEASCDAAVVSGGSAAERRAYGELLIQTAACRDIPFTTQFGGGKKLMKARLYDLFHPGKRSRVLVGAVLLACLLAGSAVACQQKEEAISEDDMLYVNETYGFTLQLPESWAGKYTVTEPNQSGTIEFCQKDSGNAGGKVFSLLVDNSKTFRASYPGMSDREIEESWPVDMRILGEGGGQIFYIIFVSDVNYDLGNEQISLEYKEMDQDARDFLSAGCFTYTGGAIPELTLSIRRGFLADGTYWAAMPDFAKTDDGYDWERLAFSPPERDPKTLERPPAVITLPLAEELFLQRDAYDAVVQAGEVGSEERGRQVVSTVIWPYLRSSHYPSEADKLEVRVENGRITFLGWFSEPFSAQDIIMNEVRKAVFNEKVTLSCSFFGNSYQFQMNESEFSDEIYSLFNTLNWEETTSEDMADAEWTYSVAVKLNWNGNSYPWMMLREGVGVLELRETDGSAYYRADGAENLCDQLLALWPGPEFRYLQAPGLELGSGQRVCAERFMKSFGDFYLESGMITDFQLNDVQVLKEYADALSDEDRKLYFAFETSYAVKPADPSLSYWQDRGIDEDGWVQLNILLSMFKGDWLQHPNTSIRSTVGDIWRCCKFSPLPLESTTIVLGNAGTFQNVN